MIKNILILLVLTTLSVVADDSNRKIISQDDVQTKMSITAEEMAEKRLQSVYAPKPEPRRAIYKPSK